MAEVAETLVAATEFAGKFKLIVVNATIGSASDTIVLTEAQVGCTSLVSAIGGITGGGDAAFSYLQVSVSTMTITVVSFEQDGTPSTEWTGTTVTVWALGQTGA